MKKSLFTLFLCITLLFGLAAPTGILSVSAESVTVATLTEADTATAKTVTDGNILSGATYGTAAKADASSLNTTLLYDGVVGGIHGMHSGDNSIVLAVGAGSTADDDSDYLYFTFNLGATYLLDQFLLGFTGDSSSNERYGIRGLELWVGDKTAAQIIAGGDTPLYSDSVVRALKPVLLTFNEAPRGRYLVVKVATSWTGGSAMVWLSEIAATGTGFATVSATTLTETDAATVKIITDSNILTGAVYGTAAGVDSTSLNTAKLYDGVVGGVHGMHSGDNPIGVTLSAGSTADDDSDYLYVTFTLGANYALDQFLLAFTGDSSSSERYGIRGLDVWVGNKTASQIITGGDAPLYSDNVVRALNPVLLTFNEKPTGRYLVVKMTTSWTGGTAAVWLSEMAATGTKVESDENTVQVVSVGDSITYGTHFINVNNWSTAQYPNKYVQVMVDKLNEQNDGNYYNLNNVAISGSAVVGNDVIGTGDSATSWYNESKNAIGYADILTIMLGTNDASANWDLRKPLYKDIYKQIVADYRAINPDLKLYILTSPYVVKEPHYTNLTNDIVPMQKELAEELNATLIDVHYWTKLKVARDGEESFIDSIDIAKGLRVHPHDGGHKLMGEIAYAGISGTALPAHIRELEDYDPTVPVVASGLTEADSATVKGLTDKNILKPEKTTYGTAATVDTKTLTTLSNNALLFDGKVGGVHGIHGEPDTLTAAVGAGSTADEDSKYLYFTFDLGGTYTLDRFLLGFTGDSSSSERYGIRGLDVWVGNKTATKILADGDNPLYSDTTVRAVKPVLLTFNQKPEGRYLVVRVATSWTGGSAMVWLSEVVATGTARNIVDGNFTVTLLDSDDGDKLINPDSNILKTAKASRTDASGTADIIVSAAKWEAQFDGLARGVNSTDCEVAAFGGLKVNDLGQDFTTIYVTFDLGDTYDLSSFLIAGQGDGTYGMEHLALYVGNQTAQDIIAAAAEPDWSYPYKVTDGLLVEFTESLTGRYLVVRLGGRSNASYYQTWLSEIAATIEGGSGSLAVTTFDSAQSMDALVQGQTNLLLGEAVEGLTLPYLSMLNLLPDGDEAYLTDGYINWTTDDVPKAMSYTASQRVSPYYDLRGTAVINGVLVASSSKDDAAARVQKVEIYVGNDVNTLFSFKQRVGVAHLDTTVVGAYIPLNTEGRYIGFKFDGIDQYRTARLTELGVYGTYTGTIEAIPANLLAGANAQMVDHFQVDARGIDNVTALTGPGLAATVAGTGNTAEMTGKREVWKFDDLAYLTDGDVNTLGSQSIKELSNPVYTSELNYNTHWIGFAYALGGETDLDSVTLVSSGEYDHRISGVQYYASYSMDDLFKTESLLYTSGGEQYMEAEVNGKMVYVADPATDNNSQQFHTYTLTEEQKTKSYRYVGIVVTRPVGVYRISDPSRLVTSANIARIAELVVNGTITKEEEKVQRVFTAESSIGTVTMEIQQLHYDDREFFLNIDHLEVTEEALPAGISRHIENNMLTMDGDKVFHLRLYDADGNQIQSDGQTRDILVTFPAAGYTQTAGILENGEIRRVYNASTRNDGTVHVGSLNYPVVGDARPSNRHLATLQQLDMQLVLLKYNDLETINKLNGSVFYSTIFEFDKSDVAGATENAPISPWMYVAVGVVGLLAVGVVLAVRRRRATRREQ